MEERGDQSTRETTSNQFEKMRIFFEKAMLDFDASLELEEKPILSYLYMMDIKKHSRPWSIRVWLFRFNVLDPKEYVFAQAMRLAPDSFILRRKYMQSLQTRWGGSPGAMNAFLQECEKTKLSREHLNALASLVLADSGWLKLQRQNFPGALEDYKKAVALTDFNKGHLFEYGIRALILHEIAYAYQNVKEYGEAVHYLNRAINAGADGPEVYFSRGLSFSHLGKKQEALDDYLKAAERGHAWSQNEVGMHYWHGIIFQRNKQEAIKWFSRSADQGFAGGKTNLEWAKKL
jgi:tetratricopeptide (TPR) repeat protein